MNYLEFNFLNSNYNKEVEGAAFLSKNYQHTIEYASRLCYNSENNMTDDSWKKYISARIRDGHESVIEHNSLIIYLKGPYISTELNLIEGLTGNSSINKSNTKHSLRIIEKKKNILELILFGNIRSFREYFKSLHSWLFDCPIEYAKRYYNRLFHIFSNLVDEIFYSDIPYFNIDNRLIIMEHLTESKREKYLNIYDKNGISVDVINIDKFDITIDDNIKSAIKPYGTITYKVKIPRVISQQDARHRVGSMSQKSQRYINETKKESGFYVPEYIDANKEYNLMNGKYNISYNEFMEISKDLYKNMIDDKTLITNNDINVKKVETSRFVLPNSIFTEYCITKPFYALDHYFDMRCSQNAQYEIREVANALKTYINSINI